MEPPKIIGDIIREVHRDIAEECGGEIREALFAFFYPKIARFAAGGVPEWYKLQLMEAQFAASEPTDVPATDAGSEGIEK